MQMIPLTQGQFAIVDDEDYEYLMQWKWCAQFVPKCRHFYAVRTITKEDKTEVVRMHREIMKCPDHLFVDHINHRTLDNRKSELRIVTKSQNNWNCRNKRGASKYKGVNIDRTHKKWCSTIQVNNKRFVIGLFKDEEDAAIAYDVAAQLLHGEYALLNNV